MNRDYHFDVGSLLTHGDAANSQLEAQGEPKIGEPGQPHQSKIKRGRKTKKAEIINFGIFPEERRLTAVLPIRTMSESNCNENWKTRHARHKKQKMGISLSLSPHIKKVVLPCSIEFVRFGPRQLDRQDNLPMSFKWICDCVCSLLRPGLAPGRADDSLDISFAYDQHKSKEYYIKIIIEY